MYEKTMFRQTEFSKEIVLLRDCKTRWSNLLLVLERFYFLKDCIKKALIDIKDTNKSMDLSHDYIKMLIDKTTELLPVKTTVEALCRWENSLFTADISIKFLIKKLKDASSAISKKLYAALLFCMEDCRTDLSRLNQYLHNGKSNVLRDFVKVPSSSKCRKIIVDLLERLGGLSSTALPQASGERSSNTDPGIVEIDRVTEPKPLSVAEELEKIIKEEYEAPMQPVRF